MTDQIILEWIKETCDAYCIPKPFAIIEVLEAARATADHRDSVIETLRNALVLMMDVGFQYLPANERARRYVVADIALAVIASPRSGNV